MTTRATYWCAGIMLAVCASVVGVNTVHAQSALTADMDRAVSRARTLVDQGNGAEARNVLDSLVNAAAAGSVDLAEALYWRATLAERLSDAERDWKRLIIESPLSPRTPDALVRLGELEMLRGHPADARPYFEQVVREFPAGTITTKSTLWLVKSHFAQNDLPQGCRVLGGMPLTDVPDGELRLQADELRGRCKGVSTSAVTAAPAPVSTPPQSAANKTPAPAPEAPPAAKAATGGRYSVQLAAYDTRKEAETAAARFVKRGMDARVDGDIKPFRVRVGRYATRAEAAAMLATLKKQGQQGFIAELMP